MVKISGKMLNLGQESINEIYFYKSCKFEYITEPVPIKIYMEQICEDYIFPIGTAFVNRTFDSLYITGEIHVMENLIKNNKFFIIGRYKVVEHRRDSGMFDGQTTKILEVLLYHGSEFANPEFMAKVEGEFDE